MTEEEIKQSEREFKILLEKKSCKEQCLTCEEIAMTMGVHHRIIRTEIRLFFENERGRYNEDEYVYTFGDKRIDGGDYSHFYYIPESLADEIFCSFRKEHLEKLKENYKDLKKYYSLPKQKYEQEGGA